jgi:hypothetical protein
VLQTYSNTGQVSVNKKIYKRFFFLTQVWKSSNKI